MLTIDGQDMTAEQCAKLPGAIPNPRIIVQRIIADGWSVLDAVYRPIHAYRGSGLVLDDDDELLAAWRSQDRTVEMPAPTIESVADAVDLDRLLAAVPEMSLAHPKIRGFWLKDARRLFPDATASQVRYALSALVADGRLEMGSDGRTYRACRRCG